MVIEDAETFRTRMRETGQMDAFLALKLKYINEGMAKKQAWEKAAAQFPPSTEPQPEPTSPLGSATLKQFEGKTNRFTDDIAWVYSNLRLEDVTPEMAPSAGAWGMLVWARRLENTTKFMDIAQKHLADIRDSLGHPPPPDPALSRSIFDLIGPSMRPKSDESEGSGDEDYPSPTDVAIDRSPVPCPAKPYYKKPGKRSNSKWP